MGKPDAILHIGQSKTGTSSIQRVLGARRAELNALGVHYPVSPGAANHGLLPASLAEPSQLSHFHPNVWEGMAPAARLARFRSEFAAEMGRLPRGTQLVLISAEQISGLLHTEAAIAKLRDLLAPYVGRVKVVMYLRRQDSHFASGYTQSLRIGHINPPQLPALGPQQMWQYDYATLLDRWARVYGEAAIVPRIFEPESLLNGDVVDDFLSLCGIELEVPPDDPDRQSNLSLTRGAIDLVRAVGEAMQASPEGLNGSSPLWRHIVGAVNEALPGRGWRPDPGEAAAFLARFAEANEAVRRRWFPDRATLFTMPEAAPAAARAAPPPVDKAAALEAACALILHEAKSSLAREAHLQAAIARLKEKMCDEEGARIAWRAALRADPTHPQAQQRLAEMALAVGDLVTAQAHLDVLRRAHPNHQLTERVARLMVKAQASVEPPSAQEAS